MNTYLNKGGEAPPRMALYLNTDNLHHLRPGSVWAEARDEAAILRLQEDGFEGIQVGGYPLSFTPDDRLKRCGLDRINHVREADRIFHQHLEAGDDCITLHVGWGIEEDEEVDAVVSDILRTSEQTGLPCFLETHRATITQDMWRTVQLVKRFPDLRINADFSHWYCGQEMVYGDFKAKLDFLQPVFDRVGFLHARIASPGSIQAAIESPDSRPRRAMGLDYLDHFKQLWTRAMAGFMSHAGKGDVLVFAPELLNSEIYYAQVAFEQDGTPFEVSDRYQEALLYQEIAIDCWNNAQG